MYESKRISRTVLAFFHIVPDELLDIIYSFPVARHHHYSLFFRECIQPLKRVLNVRPSYQRLRK